MATPKSPKHLAEKSTFDQFEIDRPAHFVQFADLPENWKNAPTRLESQSLRYYVVRLYQKVNDVRVWAKPASTDLKKFETVAAAFRAMGIPKSEIDQMRQDYLRLRESGATDAEIDISVTGKVTRKVTK